MEGNSFVAMPFVVMKKKNLPKKKFLLELYLNIMRKDE
jgi:hypothetical protein